MPQNNHSFLPGAIEILVVLILGLLNPYFSILVTWYLGFLILKDRPPMWRITMGPAVGMGVVIITVHMVSLLKLPLEASVVAVYLMTFAAWWISDKRPLALSWGRLSLVDRLSLSASILLSAGLKIPFLGIPSYSSAPKDPIFHAYKTWEIIGEGTVFITHKPISFSGILTYPAGYHSLVAWISLASGGEVPFSMMALKLFTWVLLPLGTYMAARVIFNERTAQISALVMPLTYMYYYYLHYSLLHLFLSYYFLLVSVSVYTFMVRHPNSNSPNNIAVLLLVVSSLLLIHPYSYLMFQAYALILTGLFILADLRVQFRPLGLFLFQSAGSFLMYYILEYPNRLNVERYSKPLFNVKCYLLKDNLHWLTYIVKQTLWNNGQFVFLPFFLVGTYWIVRKRTKGGMALLLTISFAFFLIFDKIWFHVNVPYYSAIWNSERIYILLTPIFPLIIGLGFSVFLERVHLTKKGLTALMLLFVIPGFYVNVDNYSREFCSTVDNSALMVFEGIKTLNGSVYVPNFKDSGFWIPIFTGREIRPVSRVPESGILYVDSRGFGDLRINPVDPLELFGKNALIMYRNGIWVFNLSMPWRESNEEALSSLYADLSLKDDVIDATNFNDWKYFVHGFLLRHPVVVRGILLGKWNGVFSISNVSYIAFIPDKNYSRIIIRGLGDDARVYLDGEYVGELEGTSLAFNEHIRENELHVLKFEGKVFIQKVILQG